MKVIQRFKNKIVLFSFIAIGSILYALNFQFHFFENYTVSTSSMYPNLKVGSTVISVGFLSPQNMDFLVYQKDGANIVSRLCGKEGDVVEIKAGDLYMVLC